MPCSPLSVYSGKRISRTHPPPPFTRVNGGSCNRIEVVHNDPADCDPLHRPFRPMLLSRPSDCDAPTASPAAHASPRCVRRAVGPSRQMAVAVLRAASPRTGLTAQAVNQQGRAALADRPFSRPQGREKGLPCTPPPKCVSARATRFHGRPSRAIPKGRNQSMAAQADDDG